MNRTTKNPKMRSACCCAIVSLAALSMTGCETGAQTGGTLGAGIGALAGQAIGGDTEGTLIGAGVGAVAGYMIGNEQDKKEQRQRIDER